MLTGYLCAAAEVALRHHRRRIWLILCTEEELLIVVKSHFISFDFCKNVVVYFNITTCFYTDDVIGAQGGRGIVRGVARVGGACEVTLLQV